VIAEALEFLRRQAVQAVAPHKVEIGDKRKLAVAIDGRLEVIDTAPTPRQHVVRCLDELVRLAHRFADAGKKPVIWFDETGATLVIDDDGHRLETVHMDFEQSDVFKVLVALRREKPWFEQKPFIRLLRIDLAGTLEPVVLLERVRKLRFENGAVTTGTVTRNQESLGREITSKVDATGDIPEDVILSAAVFKTLGLTSKRELRCSVEVDPSLGRLQLLPLPDEIERVMLQAVESIGGFLSGELAREGGEPIPAYYGRPEPARSQS
jgi:hypothetical protein